MANSFSQTLENVAQAEIALICSKHHWILCYQSIARILQEPDLNFVQVYTEPLVAQMHITISAAGNHAHWRLLISKTWYF